MRQSLMQLPRLRPVVVAAVARLRQVHPLRVRREDALAEEEVVAVAAAQQPAGQENAASPFDVKVPILKNLRASRKSTFRPES